MSAVEDAVGLLLCNLLRVYKQSGFKNLLKERGETCPSHGNHTKLLNSCGQLSHLYQLH